MLNRYKIVDFDQYCPKCKHEKIAEEEEPCRGCLSAPAGVDSKIPQNFKKKTIRVKFIPYDRTK